MADEKLPAVVMLQLNAEEVILVGNALAMMQGTMTNRLDISLHALRASRGVWDFDTVLTIQTRLRILSEAGLGAETKVELKL